MTPEQLAAIRCINLILPGSRFANIQRIVEAFEITGKRCCRCHEFKPNSAYRRTIRRPDGLAAMCRSCYESDYGYIRKKQRAEIFQKLSAS